MSGRATIVFPVPITTSARGSSKRRSTRREPIRGREADGEGGSIHLTRAVEDWLVPGRNPFGLYLYTEEVDALAAAFAGETIGMPEDKPWGMYEFALSDPQGTLVRLGWPSRSRGARRHQT